MRNEPLPDTRDEPLPDTRDEPLSDTQDEPLSDMEDVPLPYLERLVEGVLRDGIGPAKPPGWRTFMFVFFTVLGGNVAVIVSLAYAFLRDAGHGTQALAIYGPGLGGVLPVVCGAQFLIIGGRPAGRRILTIMATVTAAIALVLLAAATLGLLDAHIGLLAIGSVSLLATNAAVRSKTYDTFTRHMERVVNIRRTITRLMREAAEQPPSD